MRYRITKPLFACAFALLVVACSNQVVNSQNTAEIKGDSAVISYPETRTVDHVDTYHGTQVRDPYRWLENQDSEEVANWVNAQNRLSRPYLEALPAREKYKKRLTALWDYEKYKVPYTINGKLFYSYNDGLQNQYVLWMADDVNATPEVLIDPNTLSIDGTVSMADFYISPKAKFLAYHLSDGGTDWKTIHIRNTQTKTDLDDVIDGVKFTNTAWLPDESGFYYSRYPKAPDGRWDDSASVSIYFHQLGTSQQDDIEILSLPDKPEWVPYATVINNGKSLLIEIFKGYEANAIYIKSLTQPNAPLVPVFDKWDGEYRFIGQQDDTLLFQTNANAPTGQVVKIDLSDMAVQTVIPATQQTLDQVSLIGGKLFAHYLKDVKSAVTVYSTQGDIISDIALNDIGQVDGFYGSKDSEVTYYKLTGFTNPGAIYQYHVATGETTLFKTINTGVDYSQYETNQVFYTSKDGTRVPMFIIHKKGIKLDGNNKTLLYGYGGFNISLQPSYSVPRMVWIEQGHVLAIANLRGGGEYGQKWHKAGTKLNKQNVFDDFSAAAEYLIAHNYTKPSKLAIQGGSNGGLLVGASITQRPDLFAAALPAVGVLDMLRYHTASANARGWSSDFGLSENPEEFNALYAYSPVHNTKAGTCYPATLITTGDHDDRVVPWHSYKFAAQLQADQGCDNPILLRVETRAGHGAGTPTWMFIEGYADQWAFLESALE